MSGSTADEQQEEEDDAPLTAEQEEVQAASRKRQERFIDTLSNRRSFSRMTMALSVDPALALYLLYLLHSFTFLV